MSIGFPPKLKQKLDYVDIKIEHFIALAHDVIEALNWNILFFNQDGIIAETPKDLHDSGEEIQIHFYNDHAWVQSKSNGFTLLDGNKNKSNIDVFYTKLDELFEKNDLVGLETKYQNLLSQFDRIKHDKMNPLIEQPNGLLDEFYQKSKPYRGTLFLLLTLIGVYVWAPLVNSNSEVDNYHDLMNLGANCRLETLDGQWWRLLSNIWIHKGLGFIHLSINCLALISVAPFIEKKWGSIHMVLMFISMGVLGSVFSILFHINTISMSASGALFGLYGILMILLIKKEIILKYRLFFGFVLIVFLIFNIYFGYVDMSGIDNVTHVSGFLVGSIVGWILLKIEKKNNPLSLVWFQIVSFVVILTTAYLTFQNTENIAKNFEIFNTEKLNLDLKIVKDLDSIKTSNKSSLDKYYASFNTNINELIQLDQTMSHYLSDTAKKYFLSYTDKIKYFRSELAKLYQLKKTENNPIDSLDLKNKSDSLNSENFTHQILQTLIFEEEFWKK